MARYLTLRAARQELASAKNRHIDLLNELERKCINENASRDTFKYLLAIPIIYAAWEGYFKISFSLCIKRKCQKGRRAGLYPGKYAALWLQKEPFMKSYISKIIGGVTPSSAALARTGAQYSALAEFSEKINNWLSSPIGESSGFDELVMTNSNVNYKVLFMNSEVIGLDLTGVPTGRLDSMVGRRNEISHGGLLTYPTESEVVELLEFCRNLITAIDSKINNWLIDS